MYTYICIHVNHRTNRAIRVRQITPLEVSAVGCPMSPAVSPVTAVVAWWSVPFGAVLCGQQQREKKNL